MTTYKPTIAQWAFGAKWEEHELPEFGEACFWHLWREIERVYWNRQQKEFCSRGHDDPEIPGLTIRPYCWTDCACGDAHKPDCPVVQPNFAINGVAIHWYKYPGRGMTCNVDWDANQWAQWMEVVLAIVRASDPADDPCPHHLRISQEAK